jgi:hypothetical protein
MKRIDRVDPVTSDQIHLILSLCRSRGQDPVSALNAAGLIRHKAKIQEDQLNTADMLILATQQSPIQLLSHHEVPRTPLDLKRFIIDFLESLKKGMEDA